ncbi:MAG: hypothetical protein JW795_23015, partial [Chitinivibrionales bacterium]|nr:hypothetical protein [Chitinivibrionales bacterium]
GGNQGLLIFTKGTRINLLKRNAKIDSSSAGTAVLPISPKSLHVPLPSFTMKIDSFSIHDSDVYVWKIVAVNDTSFATIANNTFMVIKDSDFGNHGGGVGIFTLLDKMPNITQTTTPIIPQQNVDQFRDSDNDRYPDWIEIAFGTRPQDPGSFPNFTLDNDQDGFADFLEKAVGTNPDSASSKPVDLSPANGIPDSLERLPSWRPVLSVDDDGDKFPNEIETLFGTDPWNPNSKPSMSIKPSVSIGKYYGALILGQNTSQPTRNYIKVTFSSDTSGDFANIDSTTVEGVAKSGVNIKVKLTFMSGEWVFYIPFDNGMNAGKFIKVRYQNRNGIICGNVDLADMENGGGPFIGQFAASTDSTKANQITPDGNNNMINPPNNQVNLTLPPAEALVPPIDSLRHYLGLSLAFSDTAPPRATLYLTSGVDSALVAQQIYWNPGQWPALGFDIAMGVDFYHIDANLFKKGDSLVLNGFFKFIKQSVPGQNENQGNAFTLILPGGAANFQKPTGRWSGWYRVKTAENNNSGPLAFIGTRAVLEAALAKTNNKAVIMGQQQIFTIDSIKRQGDALNGPWAAHTLPNNQWSMILEKPGDYKNVYIIPVPGTSDTAIALAQGGGGDDQNKDFVPFTGDSTIIVNRLGQVNNTVTVAQEPPIQITVVPQSLHREGQAPNQIWVINSQVRRGQPQRYVFLGNKENTTQLMIDQNQRPVVKLMKIIRR